MIRKNPQRPLSAEHRSYYSLAEKLFVAALLAVVIASAAQASVIDRWS